MAVTARCGIIRDGDSKNRLKSSATHLCYSHIATATAVARSQQFGTKAISVSAHESNLAASGYSIHTDHQAKPEWAGCGFNFSDIALPSAAACRFGTIKVAYLYCTVMKKSSPVRADQ